MATRQQIDKAVKKVAVMVVKKRIKVKRNWTMAPGTMIINSSPQFKKLCDEVERIIRGDAFALINGRANDTARMIMAQLAHVHGCVPGNKPKR